MSEQETNLATEILHEMKVTNKRLFIALILSFLLNVGFLIYLSLPVEQYDETTYTQENDNSSSNMIIGGDYNGEAIGN